MVPKVFEPCKLDCILFDERVLWDISVFDISRVDCPYKISADLRTEYFDLMLSSINLR